ncbi:MAG: YggT family protein [Proteobacteria bacterium]|nr:YggT family protein [Pseudomonadota bacterium]MBI3499562.1 YggT family protein [Pseudomonadota bacterium]
MLNPVSDLILVVLELYTWVVIISAIMSWLVAFNVVNTSNRLVYTIGEFLYRLTEPALRPIRRHVPMIGGVDISPIVLLLGLYFLKRLVIWVSVNYL